MSIQRKAVEEAVLKVTGTYTNTLKEAQKEEVLSILQKGLLDGTISLSGDAKSKYSSKEGSLKYAKNILSNYLRKSALLNGGNPPIPKTRKNARIETLKKLLDKGNLSIIEKDAISSEIDALTKPKEEVNELIDMDDLPDNLKELF